MPYPEKHMAWPEPSAGGERPLCGKDLVVTKFRFWQGGAADAVADR